ncbi:GntR domain protein (Modular protein) [Bosea sp. LC85]|uniref:FadR/GntR family transcriptional regulator n=1 Tax=Bosea sp. LC85 TaxID=1502851 RepID=UPI0004E3FC5D|nr:FadR/GntR family transcriptional regulator [Bosea sp. LC85]KFC63745.1 GntR domain protein (Modular protein) [Bosea sp. LC85]
MSQAHGMRKGAKPGKIGAMVAALGAAIVRGEIAPGTVLPPEHELEAHYRVGRSVVREAMKTLAAKGLVSVRPRHGTHVRPAQDWMLLDSDVLGWVRIGGGLDRSLLLALEETRAIIEPAAAALAAQRATPEDVWRIKAALAAMDAGQFDPQAAIAADKAFHLAILEATHNPVLRSFRGAIDAILSAIFDITVGVFTGNLPNHAAVARAIEARNAKQAREAMEVLLGYTYGHLLSDGAITPPDLKKSTLGETP